MAKLDTINENSPQGSDLISNDEAARQRELRAAMVETFEVEHYLTGEHKFPAATTTPSTLTDGQLHLNTLDNGLLTLSGQSFQVGSVRDFLFTELRGYLTVQTIDSNPNYRVSQYSMPKGPLSQIIGCGVPFGSQSNLLQARLAQGTLLSSPTRRFFSPVQLAKWEAVVGTYQLRAHCRYFNGASGVRAFAPLDGTLSIYSSHQPAAILATSGFAASLLDTDSCNSNTAGVFPAAMTRRDLGVSTFSVSAAGEYTLRAEVTGSDRLGITALSLRIERIK